MERRRGGGRGAGGRKAFQPFLPPGPGVSVWGPLFLPLNGSRPFGAARGTALPRPRPEPLSPSINSKGTWFYSHLLRL